MFGATGRKADLRGEFVGEAVVVVFDDDDEVAGGGSSLDDEVLFRLRSVGSMALV